MTRVPSRTTCKASIQSCRTSQRRSQIAKENLKWCFQRNQQYSITALTNGGGTITERYAYTAYGTPTILNTSLSPLATSAEGNRYTYTGREYDEAIFLYHYRARMYDSVAGRFCSNDPIGYLDGFLRYMFLSGGVLDSIDPLGKQTRESTQSICQRIASNAEAELNSNNPCPLKTVFTVRCLSETDNNGNTRVGGSLGCTEENANGDFQLSLKLYIEGLPPDYTDAQKESYFTQIVAHESVHMRDHCNCERKCDMFRQGGKVLAKTFYKKNCLRFFCTEVRAYSVDGEFDHAQDDEEKKRLIFEHLRDNYLRGPRAECGEESIQSAIDQCYVPIGDVIEYPHPLLQ